MNTLLGGVMKRLLFTLLGCGIIYGNYTVKDENRRFLGKKHLFISLGWNCRGATVLSKLGCRVASFPLDWVISYTVDSVIASIDDDFKDFVNFNYLEKVYDLTSFEMDEIPSSYFPLSNAKDTPRVYNNKYKIYLPHIFGNRNNLKNSSKGLVPISNKFKGLESKLRVMFSRRAKRFNRVMNLGVPIYFIRVLGNDRKDDLLKLRGFLRKKYPQTSFKIIILNHSNKKWKWDLDSQFLYPLEGEHLKEMLERLDLLY